MEKIQSLLKINKKGIKYTVYKNNIIEKKKKKHFCISFLIPFYCEIHS